MALKYRKDIQILRGIAVLFVVLFHLEIGGFQSGFLGVDVFFVISGFLMAHLYNPNEKQKFFQRRALRLLPTYFMVVLFSLIVAIFITAPSEFSQISTQSLYATALSSNIGFWMENSYFSKINFTPLLHLWSLGVEIHFYLLIPFLFFIFKLQRYLLITVLLLSLFLSFTILGVSPKTSFFLMPLRAWEFLIGYAIVFYSAQSSIKFQAKEYLGTIALLVLIAIPLFPVDGKSLNFLTGHPGIYALLISLATATILLFGLSKPLENSIFGDALEHLGEYSYSIYLVHFPIIVFFLYQPFSGTILKTESMTEKLTLLLIISVTSILSYQLVEKRLKNFKYIKQLLIISPILIISIAFGGASIQERLFTQKELLITHAVEDRATYRCGKLIRILEPSTLTCNLTKLSQEKIQQKILLLGDSHADAIKTTFSQEAKEMQSEVYFFVSNSVLLNEQISPQKIIEEAQNKDIDTIVVHYSKGIKKNLEKIKELSKLAKEKSIFVAYLMNTPLWKVHIPKALWEEMHQKREFPKRTLAKYTKYNGEEYHYLKQLESSYFKIYQTADIFCQGECLYVTPDGAPLYFDDGHLTLTGSRYLKERFAEIIAKGLEIKQKSTISD